MMPLIKKPSLRVKRLKRGQPFVPESKTFFIRDIQITLTSALIVFLIVIIITFNRLPVILDLNEGDIATEDVYAPFNFSYEVGIDDIKTKNAQKEAAGKVPDIYTVDISILESAKTDCVRLFDEIIQIKDLESNEQDNRLRQVAATSSGAVTYDELKAIVVYPDIWLLKEKSVGILKEILSQAIVSDEAKRSLLESGAADIIISRGLETGRTAQKIDSLLTLSDSRKVLDSLLAKTNISQKHIRDIIEKLISNWLGPNLFLDTKQTELAKRQAASSVLPIYNIINRAKGEVIIRKGQKVTKDHILQFTRINTSTLLPEGHISHFFGIAILIGLMAFLLLLYVRFFEPGIFYDNRLLFLIGFTILFATLLVKIVVYSTLSSYFIPISAVAMLLTLLINGGIAAIGLLSSSVIAAIIAGTKFNIFLVSIIGGMTGLCSIYNARHRSQIIKSGIYAGIANFIVICAIGILFNFEIKIFLKEGLWGIGSGITSAAITMVLLPFIESTFKLTTDIRLLELSDLNHPLLKEMVMTASGTYHHSMVVGNLSEAACDAIGANSLLARVGAYYHDIGKIKKAQYFAENQPKPIDIHNSLSPSMSSLIITNHVKDGVELAEQYKLGNAIKDIIEQHHGMGLVTYFYHQALEKMQDEEPVKEEGFRYPGPKPQTRESAVVMLADSVEAASRILQNPIPQQLKELVRKIINNKFIDRQLDECELTLKDIAKISDSFVRILTGIYHTRIEYPTDTIKRHADIFGKRTKKNQS